MASTKSKSRKKTAPKKKAAKKSAGGKKSTASQKRQASTYTSLDDIRREIDTLDDVIVPLLCQRHHAVTQAAQFKPSVKGVVVPSRVESIIAKVRKAAKRGGANPDAIESVYRTMIDAFTKDEQRHWRKINKT